MGIIWSGDGHLNTAH